MNQVNDTKAVFTQRGTCSQTFAYLLAREFGSLLDEETRATDPLAGGLMNSGHQCGMIWGAVLATGAEAYLRYDDPNDALAAAMSAAVDILKSFEAQSGTISCREITGCNLSTSLGMAKFMLKTKLTGRENSTCFNLAEQWSPQVQEAAREALVSDDDDRKCCPDSCASRVVAKMGGTRREQVMVAGFAGGLGLSGSACGALSAAIWYRTLLWCREHPGENPPYFKNVDANRLLVAFRKGFGQKLSCEVLVGRRFNNIKEHSDFVTKGGCQALIELLANSAEADAR